MRNSYFDTFNLSGSPTHPWTLINMFVSYMIILRLVNICMKPESCCMFLRLPKEAKTLVRPAVSDKPHLMWCHEHVKIWMALNQVKMLVFTYERNKVNFFYLSHVGKQTENDVFFLFAPPIICSGEMKRG